MLISFGPFPTLSSAPYPTPSHPHPHFPPSLSVDPPSGGEWSAWSVCSTTCGEGWQSRTRLCVSVPYSTQCSGPLREQRPCNNTVVCPGKHSPPQASPHPTIFLIHFPSPIPHPLRSISFANSPSSRCPPEANSSWASMYGCSPLNPGCWRAVVRC